MGEKKRISIILFVLLLGLIPLTVAAESQTTHPLTPAGYGEKQIYGVFPRVSGNSITLFMVLPFLGRITINKTYFSGHLGILLIYGIYNWTPNGPPAFSTPER
jgi:hypothetical protein